MLNELLILLVQVNISEGANHVAGLSISSSRHKELISAGLSQHFFFFPIKEVLLVIVLVYQFPHCASSIMEIISFLFVTEHEVSFTLNLFQKGYFIGKPSEVLFTFFLNLRVIFSLVGGLILDKIEDFFFLKYVLTFHKKFQTENPQPMLQDMKSLHPYDRASESLFSVSSFYLSWPNLGLYNLYLMVTFLSEA